MNLSRVHQDSFQLECPAGAEPWLPVSVAFAPEDESASPIIRPAFWSGESTWTVRFASPLAGRWRRSIKVHGRPPIPWGSVEVLESPLLCMASCRKSAQWRNGGAFFPVADTAWALPWRATHEEAIEYAEDRRAKGFTAALLMTLQPDTKAEGPDDPTAPRGFRRLVQGLEEGVIGAPNLSAMQAAEDLILILLERGIVPFHTPLFYGFGWKGLDVIGPKADPEEAAWFARMLEARFGAWPGMWVVGADGTGREPAVAAMGRELARWTSQPIGIHYNPWNPGLEAADPGEWCGFHLIQTGHGGQHRPDRVALLSAWTTKAVANGEPTYEGMQNGALGAGEWQAVEAWSNFCSGGTFGVFYGAGSLWQWKRTGEEEDWDAWCCGPWDWRRALSLPGASHVGRVASILSGLDLRDLRPDIQAGFGSPCVSRGEELAVAFFAQGGSAEFKRRSEPARCRAISALSGELILEATMEPGPMWPLFRIDLPKGVPVVVILDQQG